MNQVLRIESARTNARCPFTAAARGVFAGHGSGIEIAEALNCCLTTDCPDRAECRDKVRQLIEALSDWGRFAAR